MNEHRHRKHLGQHFLHDPFVIERIITAVSPQAGQTVFEVGPGAGAISVPLLQASGALYVVEMDDTVVPLLKRHCEGLGQLHIHQGDVLKLDIDQFVPKTLGQIRLVGNLPYNISTPLFFHFAKYLHRFQDLHVMVQKEVAERVVSAPDCKQYGRLSVMMQYYFHAEILFHIGPGAFNPPPKVDSSVMRLLPHKQPPVEVGDIGLFKEIVAAAFGQRRKTIRNTLKNKVSPVALEAAGINPGLRPENLTLADFAAISRVVSQSLQGEQNPD